MAANPDAAIVFAVATSAATGSRPSKLEEEVVAVLRSASQSPAALSVVVSNRPAGCGGDRAGRLPVAFPAFAQGEITRESPWMALHGRAQFGVEKSRPSPKSNRRRLRNRKRIRRRAQASLMADLQRQNRLLAVVKALRELDRCCLSLRAEGLRYREIAEVLGISLGSVANSLEKSLSRLSRADEGGRSHAQ